MKGKGRRMKNLCMRFYQNPVITGMNPDPSICRSADGKGFYLVTSSFEYFPAVPLYYSEDLVHWKLVNYVLKRESQVNLHQVPPSGGIWAPTIRCHKGRYYMTTTNRTMGGNFFVWTDDPEGDWSDPIFVCLGGIDPSFTFEGDKVYYYGACENKDGTPGISMMEIDIKTGKPRSDIHFLWAGSGGRSPEAPHIYKKDGWYYLTIAEGGTQFGHMETVARSKDIWGPYEACPYNPILTNLHTQNPEVQCTGHSDLVEDTYGNWWAVHLGIRISRKYMSHLGRETFLSPVTWTEDGWPLINQKKWVEQQSSGPLLPEWKPEEAKKEHFQEDNLDFSWNYLRNPELWRYDLKKNPGAITILGSAVTIDELASPTLLCQRQKDFQCQITCSLDFEPEQDGEEAGLVIFLSNEFYYKLVKRRELGQSFLFLEKRAEDMWQQAFKTPVEEKQRLYLSCLADALHYHFSWGYDEDHTREAGIASTRFLSCEVAGRSFTGTFVGLYASGNGKEMKAQAAFYDFKMR